MAGRAGRKGAGRARGEALVVAANKGQATRATGLMNAGLAAVKRRERGRSFCVFGPVWRLGSFCGQASFAVLAHSIDSVVTHRDGRVAPQARFSSLHRPVSCAIVRLVAWGDAKVFFWQLNAFDRAAMTA